MGIVKGVSGMVLLPARDYEWELVGRHTIEVPVSGKISDLLSETELASGFSIPGEDEFSITDDSVFLLWELVRVLFAASKYPALEVNEYFNVMALEQVGAKLLVHGEIIRSVGE
jgi:hypothetical protein